MEEPHIEGLATHNDPESCVEVRKELSEALTGARTGRVLSPVKTDQERRRTSGSRKATRHWAYEPVQSRLLGVGDPLHVRNLQVREPGDPWVPHRDGAVGRDGNTKATSRRCTIHGSLTDP